MISYCMIWYGMISYGMIRSIVTYFNDCLIFWLCDISTTSMASTWAPRTLGPWDNRDMGSNGTGRMDLDNRDPGTIRIQGQWGSL